jgi:hypothetical protein
VRDDITGALYDIDERSMRSGFTRVEGHPVLEGDGAQPRPDKPFVAKDGTPAQPQERGEPEPEPAAEPKPEPAPKTRTRTRAPAKPADTEE